MMESPNPWRFWGITLLIFAAVLLASALSPLWAAEIRVTDGDTIRIGDERIRLLGLDTPEKRHLAECLAERMLARLASERLEELVYEIDVVIERDGIDRFGRTLARVFVEGEDAAEVLVREGLARRWEGRQVDWCR